MDNIRDLLDGEIEKTLVEISKLTPSSSEAKAELAKLTLMYDRLIKSNEIDLKERQRLDSSYNAGNDFTLKMRELEQRKSEKQDEFELKKKEFELREKEIAQKERQLAAEKAMHEAELEAKRQEIKGNKIDRIISTVLNILGIVVPISISSYWMKKGLQFEESGTYTTRTPQWVSTITRMFKKG